MERGSTHGPHVDEQLKRETEPLERGSPESPRVEEHRMTEESGRELGDRLDLNDPEARSLIARHLDRIAFPGRRDAFISDAIENNAPPAVIGALRSLPADTTFENMQQIWMALGGAPEERF